MYQPTLKDIVVEIAKEYSRDFKKLWSNDNFKKIREKGKLMLGVFTLLNVGPYTVQTHKRLFKEHKDLENPPFPYISKIQDSFCGILAGLNGVAVQVLLYQYVFQDYPWWMNFMPVAATNLVDAVIEKGIKVKKKLEKRNLESKL